MCQRRSWRSVPLRCGRSDLVPHGGGGGGGPVTRNRINTATHSTASASSKRIHIAEKTKTPADDIRRSHWSLHRETVSWRTPPPHFAHPTSAAHLAWNGQHIIDQAQYSYIIATVIGSAVLPTLIANAFFVPHYLLPKAETPPPAGPAPQTLAVGQREG